MKGDIKLSVKQKLEELLNERKVLNEKLEPISAELDKLYSEERSLTKKVKQLSERSSSVAKTLLAKAETELTEIKQKIHCAEEAETILTDQITEVESEISKRLDSTDLYIKEQSVAMTNAFIEYLKANAESIGYEITKTFKVLEITSYHDGRYSGCDVPTGKIGIYDIKNKNFIISSNDFYFTNQLYTIKCGAYDELDCIYTDWYNDYHKKFIATFLKTLKRTYTGDDFKLTIKNPKFTLELV